MTGLDRADKTITLARTVDEENREISPEVQLSYDTLIVAVGSVTIWTRSTRSTICGSS